MTTKTKRATKTNPETSAKVSERNRKAAIAEIDQRIKSIDADETAAACATVGERQAEPAPHSPKNPADLAAPPSPDAVPLRPKPAKGRKAKAPEPQQPTTAPMSGLDAAAHVLAEAGVAMNCKDLSDSILAQKLWSTQGRTPAATIYAAIIREIASKGADSRFRRTDRGLFEFVGS
jgi:hypothetical protein